MPFDLTSPLPEKGVNVPIYATFTGHKRMPFWWALGTNSYKPVLRLFEDELELKVMKTHRRLLRDIETAHVGLAPLTRNLILVWNDTPWTFTANVIRHDWLVQVIEFLARKNVPLAPGARRLLQD